MPGRGIAPPGAEVISGALISPPRPVARSREEGLGPEDRS